MREEVVLSKDCEAVLIPSGEKVLVPEGTHASITQSLGGAYTIITDRGMMVRLSGKAVEAIGKEALAAVQTEGTVSDEELDKMVWEQLRTCFDPEIPVNIVDLGLVYLCNVTATEGGGHDVEVKMTLTAPGCGMGPVLAADVEGKIKSLPSVRETNIQVVFDPQWDRSMMTEAAKLQLGMMW